MKANLNENYFSEAMKWMSTIIIIGGNSVLMVYTDYNLVFAITFLFIPILFTSKYEIEIDKNEGIVDDAFVILGVKLKSNKKEFKELKGIRIDKEKHSYTANTRSRVRQVNFNEYTATLEYDNGQALELTRNSDYKEFEAHIFPFAATLDLEIYKSF